MLVGLPWAVAVPCSLTLACCLSVHFAQGCQMTGRSHTVTLISYKSRGLCGWEELSGCQLLRPPRGTSDGEPRSALLPALTQDHSLQGQGGLGDEEGMLSFPQVPSLQNPSALHPARCHGPSGWAPESPQSAQEVPRVPAGQHCPEQADLPPDGGRRHQLGSLGKTGWLRTRPWRVRVSLSQSGPGRTRDGEQGPGTYRCPCLTAAGGC